MKNIANQDVLEFLRQAKNYPHPVYKLEERETHISHVFLTGEYAYKLKKSVKFDFLDFSTLDKRKHFCEEEVRVNSRFAPDIYEKVVAIWQWNDELSLLSGTKIVEYLVKMKQFASEDLFDSLEKQGKLRELMLEEITDEIVRFHESAESQPSFWGVDAVARAMNQNFAVFQSFSPEVIEEKLLTELIQKSEEEFSKVKPLIEKRQKTHVRAVHGDMHLGNMCLFEGHARLFDGIEFNPELSNCDVWADLAFFLMDLCVRDKERDAALVWNRYLQETDDFEGFELLNLYLAYRAAVRAKVSLLSLKTSDAAAPREKLHHEALDYLDLSLYSLKPTRGKVIAIGGLSGSGKSTVSELLAINDHGVHIRSDAVRKHLCNTSLYKAAPPEAYSEDMNRRTYMGMLERARHVLRSGKSVILDAVFHSPVWRTEVEKFAKRENVSFTGFWLNVSPKIAKERIRTRLDDISDADEGILSKQQLYNLEAISWIQVDTSSEVSEALGIVQGICSVV